MPNWKKVILSGSNAHVNNISASGHFSALGGSATINTNTGNEGILNLTNESGTSIDSGDKLGVINFIGTGSSVLEGPSAIIQTVARQDFDSFRKGSSLEFYTANNGDSGTPTTLGDAKMIISESGILFSTNIITTDITSSSNISASGYISASEFVGLVKTAETASYVLATNIDQPFTNITASGNISASGTIESTGAATSNKFLSSNSGGYTAPAYSFKSDPNTGIYQPAPDNLSFSTGGTNRFNINSSGVSIPGPGQLIISGINEDTSNGYKPVVVNTSNGQLYYTASDAFDGGGGGTLDEVTTSGNQTTNTIRVGELTASLVTDPTNINVLSGDTTGSGDQDVVTVQYHVSPPSANFHTFAAGEISYFNITTGFTGYTGNLYLEKVRIKGDVDTATNEKIEGFFVGGQYIILEANNVTTSSNTYATIFTGSRWHIDNAPVFSTYTPISQLPDPPYEDLSQDGNFKLQFGNGNINEITCDNGVVAGQVSLGSGVNPNLGNVPFALEFTFRKPTPSFNNGAGLFSGVDSNNFASQIKHVGPAKDGQDPSGLLISLGNNGSVNNNAEFIRFTSHFGGLTETLNDVILSDSDVGGIIMSNGQATLAPPSDKRLKKNIVPISSSLNQILNLNPVDFTWKNTNINNVGFIAQEIYDIIPHAAIPGNEDTSWKINYNNIIPYLVKAIQEQQVTIEELKTQINNLSK